MGCFSLLYLKLSIIKETLGNFDEEIFIASYEHTAIHLDLRQLRSFDLHVNDRSQYLNLDYIIHTV